MAVKYLLGDEKISIQNRKVTPLRATICANREGSAGDVKTERNSAPVLPEKKWLSFQTMWCCVSISPRFGLQYSQNLHIGLFYPEHGTSSFVAVEMRERVNCEHLLTLEQSSFPTLYMLIWFQVKLML